MEETKKTWKPSPTAILNPRLDINFKAIFTQDTEGAKIALKSFLSAAIGRQVTEVTLGPNEPSRARKRECNTLRGLIPAGNVCPPRKA